jgi:crotonobetainyl-CoA:carnitine CoA-transferase CaiB-like acyl-CoA transferase
MGALDGLRVVDLSRVLAGPLCTQMLADHGADVVKVEPPAGDETRTFGPPFDASGDAAYFSAVNRGKRSIALDLSKPEGRAIVERLLADADVLVENFLPGTMERWGLGHATLAERHPRLVYCSISGFGADGPLGGLPGYDAVLQAICGVMSVNGSEQSGAMRLGIPVVDHVTGFVAVTGILMALHERSRTGLGQRVDATLFDTGLSLLVPHAANWLQSGRTPGRLGSAHPNISPYDKFRAGEAEIFLGVGNDGQFRRLCEVLGSTWLADDPRFATNASRVEHRDAMRAALEAALATQDAAALCEALMRAGVPAGVVNSIPDALSHPHAAHRRMRVEDGAYRGVGSPIKLSNAAAMPARRPPRFAEHGTSILGDVGCSPDDIAALRAAGVAPEQPIRRTSTRPIPEEKST